MRRNNVISRVSYASVLFLALGSSALAEATPPTGSTTDGLDGKIVAFFKGLGAHRPPHRDVFFPVLSGLGTEKRILEGSDDVTLGRRHEPGVEFYESEKTDDQYRATFLNLTEKMRSLKMGDGKPLLSHVGSLWKEKKDRFFVVADGDVYDLLQTSPLFYHRTESDSRLHHAKVPETFRRMADGSLLPAPIKLGSFKTFDRHGNLDITVTEVPLTPTEKASGTPRRISMEVDRDEEREGFMHLMRVIYHTGLDKKTNAYKIEQSDELQGHETTYAIVPRGNPVDARYDVKPTDGGDILFSLLPRGRHRPAPVESAAK